MADFYEMDIMKGKSRWDVQDLEKSASQSVLVEKWR